MSRPEVPTRPNRRPNTATERLCVAELCGQLLHRDDTDRPWRHVERPPYLHPPRPAAREYDLPCRCGRATAHLAGPRCKHPRSVPPPAEGGAPTAH